MDPINIPQMLAYIYTIHGSYGIQETLKPMFFFPFFGFPGSCKYCEFSRTKKSNDSYLVGGDWNMIFICSIIYGKNHPNWMVYPLVMTVTVCELENGPVEIVDLPIDSMVMFHSFLYVYQRV